MGLTPGMKVQGTKVQSMKVQSSMKIQSIEVPSTCMKVQNMAIPLDTYIPLDIVVWRY